MRFNAFFLLLLVLTSCYQEPYKDLSIFKYNETSAINSLDPAFAKDQATVWATNQLFNGLVQLDENLNIQPSVAHSWNIINEGLTYRFFLRSDVYFHEHSIFHNGTRIVTAHDFEYSFSRLLDNNIVAPGRWVLNNVKNFYAENDSVFVINLTTTFPAFISLLSMQYCSVVPREVVELGDFGLNPIGTGPFKFQIWQQGVKMVFRKNNKYFEYENENRLPYLDAVSISFISDKQSAFMQFIQGNLDFLSGIDISYKDEILSNDGKLNPKYSSFINLNTSPYLNTEYLGFLMKDSLPIEIRKAINYGFDRRKMIKYLRNNVGIPAVNGFIPYGMPSFSNFKGFDYNPKKAEELIKNSDFDLNTNILISTTSSYLDLCEYIQNELKNLGLNISIDVNPPSTHRQLVATSKLSVFRASWIADYPDAENYLSLFYSENLSPNGPNYTHFQSDEFDDLYVESLSQTNDSVRYLTYSKMDKMIMDKAVIIPLYYDQVLRFTQKDIIGLKNNPMNLLNLKRVKKK